MAQAIGRGQARPGTWEVLIERSAILSGRGVHSGIPARLRISLRASSQGLRGPRLRFPGFSGPLSPADLSRLPRQNRRGTLLGKEGVCIRTPEHVMAALLFFSDLPVDMDCDGPEMPGLDGSALPFREALTRLAPEKTTAPAWLERDCDLVWEHAGNDGDIKVRPAGHFSVAYELERGPLRETYRLDSAEAAWREILPARTFIFHREFIAHREYLHTVKSDGGLLQGAELDSGILLAESEAEHGSLLALHPEWNGGPFPLLNQRAWRMGGEPVKHKILDLIGDLALLELALPRLDIRIRNGGHLLNHLLLERITNGR